MRTVLLCPPASSCVLLLYDYCAAHRCSFFNDCQSLRELRIIAHNNCSMPRKAPSVGSHFKCNGPFYFSWEEDEVKRFTCTHGSPPSFPPPPPYSSSPLANPPHHHHCHPRYCTPAQMRLHWRFLWRGGWSTWIWQSSVIVGWIMIVGNPARAYESGTDQQWPRPLFQSPGAPALRTEKARGGGGGVGIMGQAHHPRLGWLHCSTSNWRRSTDLLDATWTVSIFLLIYSTVS